MNAKIYFGLLGLVYATILKIKVSGNLAVFHFYLPMFLLLTWLIAWIIVETFSFLYTSKNDLKIIKLITNTLYGIMLLAVFYIGGLYLFQNSYDFSESQIIRGKIVELKENWLPFTDSFNTRIIKIKSDNSEKWIMVGNKNRMQLWLGQDVQITESFNYPSHYLNFEFDILTWHNRILKKWPHSKKSWQEIINYYQLKDQNKELVSSIEKYVQNFSVDKYFVDYANSFWLKNNLKDALTIFEAGYRVNPHHYDLLKYYGFYLAKKGDSERGIALLEEACQIRPDNFEAFYQLGLILYEKGNKERALPVLKRALELNSNLGDVKGIIQTLEKS